jgi:GTP-binding protein
LSFLQDMQIKTSVFALGVASWKNLPDDKRPEVAFVGRSNVGKSSLINMLLGRKDLARTSNQPGKTRELNYYLINDAFYFVDLPGFGYAKTSKVQRSQWATLISRYIDERDTLRLLIHVVDGRHEPTAIDREVMSMMRGLPQPYVIALSKIDKLSGNDRNKSLARAAGVLVEHQLEVPLIQTSAQTRRGRDELLSWIETSVS